MMPNPRSKLVLLAAVVSLALVPIAGAQQSNQSNDSAIELPSPTMTSLARQLAAGNGAALDAFWLAIDGRAPLIEPDPSRKDRSLVTFLYRGTGDTQAVAIQGAAPEVDSPALLSNLEGSDLWYRTQSVPTDSRLYYWFRVLEGDDAPTDMRARLDALSQGDRRPDALSGRPTRHEGQATYLELPGAFQSPWIRPRSQARDDALDEYEIESAVLDETRTIYAYTPPGFDARRGDYPVLIVFDGALAGANPDSTLIPTPTILDNLIEAGEIPACVALLIPNESQQARTRDLTCSDAFVEFLADELLPWAREELGVTNDPDKTLVTGVSYGGLAAVHAGLARPDVFGLVLAQSPSLWHSPDIQDPTHDFTSGRGWLIEAYAQSERLPGRISMCVGTMEQFNYQANMTRLCRSLHSVLLARGAEVTYREYNAGHVYEMWANDLPEGLITLLGSK